MAKRHVRNFLTLAYTINDKYSYNKDIDCGTECEAGELLDELGGRASVLRAGAPLPADRVRLLQADARQAPAQFHARLQSCRVRITA